MCVILQSWFGQKKGKRSAERSKQISFKKLKDIQASKGEENQKTGKLNIVTQITG